MAEHKAVGLQGELEQLEDHLKTAEKSVYLASRHAQNRGLKLLLKSYAERLARFSRDLARLVGEHSGVSDMLPAVPERGWLDVSTPLILGRENRQNAALRASYTHVEAALAAYQRLLDEDPPEQIAQLAGAQQAYLHGVFASLESLMGASERRLEVRLFEDETEANWAVERLQRAGYREQDIIVHPIDEGVVVYRQDDREQGRSTRGAVGTAAVMLAVLFAVIAALANLVRSATSEEGLPLVASWEFWLPVVGALVVGALFGTVFGLLLGRGVSEEDASLYEQSLKPGNVLVFVWTTAEDEAKVDRILKLEHERELTI
jgi:hypothetical protein